MSASELAVENFNMMSFRSITTVKGTESMLDQSTAGAVIDMFPLKDRHPPTEKPSFAQF